ncbi:hypothetical protein GCM10009603_24400 [Nocardiopsis exhalans]
MVPADSGRYRTSHGGAGGIPDWFPTGPGGRTCAGRFLPGVNDRAPKPGTQVKGPCRIAVRIRQGPFTTGVARK